MELSPDASKFKLAAVYVHPNAFETRETGVGRDRESGKAKERHFPVSSFVGVANESFLITFRRMIASVLLRYSEIGDFLLIKKLCSWKDFSLEVFRCFVFILCWINFWILMSDVGEIGKGDWYSIINVKPSRIFWRILGSSHSSAINRWTYCI